MRATRMVAYAKTNEIDEVISADAKRNSLNHIFSEAVLQAVQNFLAPITDDFRKPRAAVHVHEQRAFVQIRRLRVRGDVRVNQRIPDFDDFDFPATRIHFQIAKNFGNDFARIARANGFCRLNRFKVNAAPLRKNFLSGGLFFRRWHENNLHRASIFREEENKDGINRIYRVVLLLPAQIIFQFC
jgi:hypothetical protein